MKEKFSVFEYPDYKAYLLKALEQRSQAGKGQRTKFAEFLGCRPSYISSVLNEIQDLSPEQAQATNEFLGHTETESDYFLNLVLYARAGTPSLRKVYLEKLKQLRDAHLQIKNRVPEKKKVLSEKDQARYYGAWYFAAIHMMVSLPPFRTREKITAALGLPAKTVGEVVEFLLEIGILKTQGAELRQGETNLFVGTDSPFLSRHLLNWRTQAIRSLDHPQKQDLHYSSVITCSKEDALKIREEIMAAIQNIRKTIQASKDETLMVYSFDFFSLLSE